jgi:hypothetical protein
MKIGHCTIHLSVLSISFAFATLAAFIVGLLAAHYWFKASKIVIDPGWRGGSPQSAADAQRLIEPGEPQLSEMFWLSATMAAAEKSADFNRVAARLTAVAVALSAMSSALGALVGFCSPQ